MTSTIKLSSIVDIVGGGTPSRSNPTYWNGTIPWVSVKDFKGKYISTSEEAITEDGLKNSSTNLIPKNSVLIPTRMALGKVGINTIPVAINQDVKALKIKNPNSWEYRYLACFLSSKAAHIISLGKGATVKGVTVDVLKDLRVPEISQQEQVEVANTFDLITSLIERRCQSLAKIDQLAQSIFLDIFGDPVSNSKNWEIKKLEELATVKIGPFGSLLHKHDYIVGGIPLVNPTHIVDLKIVPDLELTVSEKKYNELSAYQMKANDIVLGRRGEMGRCALVTQQEDGYLCGTGSMFIRSTKAINPIFLLHLLSSEQIKKELENKAKGVTMMNLNAGTVSGLNLIYPDLKVQNKFVETLVRINKMKEQLQKSLFHFEDLQQSLSQQFFGN